MDRKSILILVVCFILLLLWPQLVNRVLYPPPPGLATTNALARLHPTNSAAFTNLSAATNQAPSPSPAGTPLITMPATPATASTAWVKPTEAEELLVWETADSRYTFTTHGGGIKLIEPHPTPVASGQPPAQPTPPTSADTDRPAALNLHARVPALALFGGAELGDNVPYRLSRTAAGVRAEKEAPRGLQVVQEFQPGTNHMLQAMVRVANRGQAPVNLPAMELVVGTATPMNRHDPGDAVRVEWYDGHTTLAADQAWFANRGFFSCLGLTAATPREIYRSQGLSNIVWASVQNQYFAMIALPRELPAQLFAVPLDLPPPTPAERAADSRLVARPVGLQTALVYAPRTLPPGEAMEWHLDLYAGPKEYDALARLSNNADLVMGFSGPFGWIARLLLISMKGLHALGLSYGLAIIAITIIIKLVFWPLTQASTRSMKRMQMLKPEMKALQAKYKDDPKKMNLKLMEFIKEHKVSPLGGCLPMLIQIPVFFGLYQMLRSAIELRGARFLWAQDLSQPDTVALIFGFPLNPLPLIMGVTTLWQARMTPPSPGVDPVQQKMMQYMPLIFVFMVYNLSAGLALYWTLQNLLSILQMKLTRAYAPGAPVEPAKKPVPAPAARPPKRK